MRIALEQALNSQDLKSKCMLSSEINAAATETYELNFGHLPEGDVREIKTFPPHDVLLAGFPCQPFSYAGKQQGFGDTRGTLFFEVERALKERRPKLFLLENVRGLTTHDNGRTLETILQHLRELGYGVDFRVLNSADHGVPQNRMRVYIFGILGHTPKSNLENATKFIDSNSRQRNQPTLWEQDSEHSVVADILEKKVDKKYFCSPSFSSSLTRFIGRDLSLLAGYRLIDSRGGRSIHSWDLGLRGDCTSSEKELLEAIIANRRSSRFGDHQDGKALTLEQISTFSDDRRLKTNLNRLVKMGYLRIVDNRYSPTLGNMSFEVYKFLDPQSVSVTLVSSDAERIGIVTDNQPRRITPREAARLQGFPDSFIVHPNDRRAYHQFGNAVSVPVVSKVLKDLITSNSTALGPKFRKKST